MKPYIDGLRARGFDAHVISLPRGSAERAMPIFLKASGDGKDVVIGGHSFGGRVASMLAADGEHEFAALLLFSYPFHRPGFPQEPRTKHLRDIRCPVLFMSGDRDPFAQAQVVKRAVALPPKAKLEVFHNAGHGLKGHLDEALDKAAEFLKGL